MSVATASLEHACDECKNRILTSCYSQERTIVRAVKRMSDVDGDEHGGIGSHNKQSAWPCLEIVFQPREGIQINCNGHEHCQQEDAGGEANCGWKARPGAAAQASRTALSPTQDACAILH